ncbi:hypothetical protein GCM10008949_51590 [Deinococcus humi]|nr:hypothetical protein GCM10008949_51590 [Deinococcus humi]
MTSGRIRGWETSLLERSQPRLHPSIARQRFQADLDRFSGAAHELTCLADMLDQMLGRTIGLKELHESCEPEEKS